MSAFSDYVVYVDESGDHSLEKIDQSFPVLVLSFCIFYKPDYTDTIVPAFQRIKFKYFGHDMVVFHERDIRKAEGDFAFLTNANIRNEFMQDINSWVENSHFTIIAIVINKLLFVSKHKDSSKSPYYFGMQLGLERVCKFLDKRQGGKCKTHFVFESRGKSEDQELELEFRRVCDGQNFPQKKLDFEIVFPGKQINSTGLQLADLTARPIGRYILNKEQPNRAYQLIEAKIDRGPKNQIEGYGLKCYP